MSTDKRMQLAYYLTVNTSVNSFSHNLQSDVTMTAYHYDPSYDGRARDTEILFTAKFFSYQETNEDSAGKNYGRKHFDTHPKNWAWEKCEGVYFSDWTVSKIDVQTTSYSVWLPDALGQFDLANKILKKINTTIIDYNLREKYQNRDNLATWLEALRILKFEQLRYDKKDYTPKQTGESKRECHNFYYDCVYS